MRGQVGVNSKFNVTHTNFVSKLTKIWTDGGAYRGKGILSLRKFQVKNNSIVKGFTIPGIQSKFS